MDICEGREFIACQARYKCQIENILLKLRSKDEQWKPDNHGKSEDISERFVKTRTEAKDEHLAVNKTIKNAVTKSFPALGSHAAHAARL